MATATFSPRPVTHGGTALGAHPEPVRHRLGDTLHAVRVCTGAAVEVVILGTDGKRYLIDPLVGLIKRHAPI